MRRAYQRRMEGKEDGGRQQVGQEEGWRDGQVVNKGVICREEKGVVFFKEEKIEKGKTAGNEWKR